MCGPVQPSAVAPVGMPSSQMKRNVSGTCLRAGASVVGLLDAGSRRPSTPAGSTPVGKLRNEPRLFDSGARRPATPANAAATSSKTFRVAQPGTTVYDLYDAGPVLATRFEGVELRGAQRRSDGKRVVLKSTPKMQSGLREWRSMMSQLMAMPVCPNLLEILEIVEDDTGFHTVMPRLDGGDLWALMKARPRLLESECKQIIGELLDGLEHLHRSNIVHQDISPANVMFDTAGGNSIGTVKVIDFDMCEYWIPGKGRQDFFGGTAGFVAPEVLLGQASPQSDLFSVGVILYVLVTGLDPMPVATQRLRELMDADDFTAGSSGARKVHNAFLASSINWNAAPWPEFHLARDLCQKLLSVDPRQRPWSARQTRQHRWLAFSTEDRLLPARQ
eukprot:TRINITY_DN17196_c0_g2_i1.p1 TRINITY_DN17196_c0_g2~~TRINITY_DN17196_c0_g2_i1.p1  ORF type:complete len:389 (+),score=80.92 TRINITY_DN17196_c0_g2_i1:77-1243(+)